MMRKTTESRPMQVKQKTKTRLVVINKLNLFLFLAAVDYSDINELADDESYDEADAPRSKEKAADESLMPPPPTPTTKTNEQNANSSASEQENGEVNKKKLDTPLAAMLPSKYADVDVTELFPDFRHGKVGKKLCYGW